MADEPTAPPATDKWTVRLVLIIFGVIAIAGTVGLFLLINKVLDYSDPARINQALVACAGLFGIVTGATGYLAGALTNTRTPQAPLVDAVVEAIPDDDLAD